MRDLASLVELLGEEVTLKLVEAYGGTRLFVPKCLPDGAHKLRDLLGDAGFALLVQYFGSLEISIPMARQWRFEIYKRKGKPARQIARLSGCTEAAYYAYLKKHNEAQLAFSFEDAGRKPRNAQDV